MTISTTTNRASFAGNGSTTAFATGFKFFANSDLTVILVVDSTGVETTKTITTHYTVADAGVDAGGTVTMVTAPAVGETLVIVRAQAYTQGLDLVENDSFPSESVEDQLDKNVIMAQQNNDTNSRSLKLSDGDTSGVSVVLPTPVALKTFRWNVGLTALEQTDDPAVSAAAAVVSAAAAAADAVLTAADAVLTAADVVSTNADVVSTNADVVTTAASAAAADVSAGIFGVKGADLTSAEPLVIGTDGNYFDVTGIVGIATHTVATNKHYFTQFDGACILTHNAITQDLPGEANITTAAGDVAEWQSTGANTVQCVNYTKADGTAVVGGMTASSTDTLTNKTFDANGTGNSITNIDVADLANGTDGELITWDAVGAPTVVAVGTATHVLTSNGVGVAPTFQAPAAGGGLKSVQVFSVGATWTKPAGITLVKVTIVGGGGAGGSDGAINNVGGGGSSGSASIKYIDVTAISSETVTIGAGGTPGAIGTNAGGNGGTTSFGAHCTAPGGQGGYYGTQTTPYVGMAIAVGTGGDINIQNEVGMPPYDFTAGTVWASAGASSILGGGGTWHQFVAAPQTLTGAGWGGGGAGGGNGSSGQAGTAGGGGICIVEEYA